MTWLDYAVIGVILGSIGWGIYRGFVREVMSLAAWVIAFLGANAFAAPIAEAMPDAISRPDVRMLVAYLLVFFVVLVVATLGALFLARLMRGAGLVSLDRTLGALFGLLRGLVIIVAFGVAAGLTPMPRKPYWTASVSGPTLSRTVNELRPWLPPALGARLKYN
jgi:membrane protein required for colicin V production